MPSEAFDTYCTVHRNGTATFLARIVAGDGAPIARDQIAAIHYSLYLLDDADAGFREAVAGHQDVGLSVTAVLLEQLTIDGRWTRDDEGYNFRHTLEVESCPAFSQSGRRYLLEYRLRPVAGQPIVARWRVNVI